MTENDDESADESGGQVRVLPRGGIDTGDGSSISPAT